MSILDYQNIVTTVSISPALVAQLQLLLHTKNYSETIRYGIAYYFLLSPKDLYINDDFYLRQLLSAEERHTKKNYSIRFKDTFITHLSNPEKEKKTTSNENNKEDTNEEIKEKNKEKKPNISNTINHSLAVALHLLKNINIDETTRLIIKLLIKLLINPLFIF